MGHAHVARPSRLQQPTIQERPEPASCDASVKDSIKRSVFLCSKKVSSAPRLNSANRGARARVVSSRVESRRDERARRRRRSARVALLFSLTYQVVQHPHLIYWSTSLSTFHVGLNLAPTTCLVQPKTWAACHMGSHT
jgi:hypothetical protein